VNAVYCRCGKGQSTRLDHDRERAVFVVKAEPHPFEVRKPATEVEAEPNDTDRTKPATGPFRNRRYAGQSQQ
jgi:hypothetical protein